MAGATWNCYHLGAFCVHHTTMHHVTSCKATIRNVYACLAVTCHLRFWQNDWGLLRATAVTWGWNGYQNKSQHRSWPWRRKFSRCSKRDLNPQPFNHKSGALTTELSRLKEHTSISNNRDMHAENVQFHLRVGLPVEEEVQVTVGVDEEAAIGSGEGLLGLFAPPAGARHSTVLQQTRCVGWHLLPAAAHRKGSVRRQKRFLAEECLTSAILFHRAERGWLVRGSVSGRQFGVGPQGKVRSEGWGGGARESGIVVIIQHPVWRCRLAPPPSFWGRGGLSRRVKHTCPTGHLLGCSTFPAVWRCDRSNLRCWRTQPPVRSSTPAWNPPLFQIARQSRPQTWSTIGDDILAGRGNGSLRITGVLGSGLLGRGDAAAVCILRARVLVHLEVALFLSWEKMQRLAST